MASHTLDIVLGNSKKGSSSAVSPEDIADGGSDDAAEGEDSLSGAATAAWEEYDAEPSAEKFSRAVKAVMGTL
jgi:hypothetical protein